MPAGEVLLEVRGLKTHFDTRQGVVKAVDGADFHVKRGEVLGLVGESGCGKSVTSLSIMGLIPHPGEVVAGEILFGGKDIAQMKAAEVRALRGEHISMIFQQPTSALNPVFTGPVPRSRKSSSSTATGAPKSRKRRSSRC